MNRDGLQTLKEGMKNTDCWYGYNRRFHRSVIEEALHVLENKEELLEQYDCYDYLFEG